MSESYMFMYIIPDCVAVGGGVVSGCLWHQYAIGTWLDSFVKVFT